MAAARLSAWWLVVVGLITLPVNAAHAEGGAEEKQVGNEMTTVVYSVADLVIPVDAHPGATIVTLENKLAGTITESIDPESWDSCGGAGNFAILPAWAGPGGAANSGQPAKGLGFAGMYARAREERGDGDRSRSQYQMARRGSPGLPHSRQSNNDHHRRRGAAFADLPRGRLGHPGRRSTRPRRQRPP